MYYEFRAAWDQIQDLGIDVDDSGGRCGEGGVDNWG
jgi:hypothetical protein